MKHEINKRLLIAAFSFFVLPNSFYSRLLHSTDAVSSTHMVLFEASPSEPITPVALQPAIKKSVTAVAKTVKKLEIHNPAELENWFNHYAATYGVAVETLKSVAKCESGFNAAAVNGKYVGLFQFAPSTWVTNRKAMGLDTNESLRTNPEEAIRTAAFKMGRDGTSAWASCVR